MVRTKLKGVFWITNTRQPLTKLPAKPPAIKATPTNSTTLARHAAGPSLPPHASPENAEWKWDLSSRETTRKPTDG